MNNSALKEYVGNDIIFDNSKKIWCLNDHEEIAYTDGKSTEAYLRRVLVKTQNLSSDSDELQKYIIDYPTAYHLSQKRSLLLHGFDFDKQASVLELGCGCGAITRFLGETFHEVISIEGSSIRAEIARLRNRDLDNVSILAAPFHKVNFTRRFDIIFCIGVLEYASMFCNSEGDTLNRILAFFHGLLTEKGVLIIAIENQFGLKYFAGCPEDHTGKVFEGIEGYPTHEKKHAVTYGRRELYQEIKKNKFVTTSFFYPFPDYKFPRCVISYEFLNDKVITNPADLIVSALPLNQDDKELLFNQRLAWYELGRNGLTEDFANSFLCLARKSDSLGYVAAPWLAKYYNIERDRQYRTITTIVRNGSMVLVTKKRMHKHDILSDILEHNENVSLWQEGQSLLASCEKKMRSRDFSFKQFVAILKPWVLLLTEGRNPSETLIVPGDALDKMPWNIIVNNGKFCIIDQEWSWKTPLTLKYCVTRGFYHVLLRCIIRGSPPQLLKGKRLRTVLKTLCTSFFPNFSEVDIKDFLEIESTFQSQVYGKSISQRRSEIWGDLSWSIGSVENSLSMVLKLKQIKQIIKKHLVRRPIFSGK